MNYQKYKVVIYCLAGAHDHSQDTRLAKWWWRWWCFYYRKWHIYLLQKNLVDGQEYTVLFDTGFSGMVAQYDAVKRMDNRAKLEVKGPISLGGVGNIKTES